MAFRTLSCLYEPLWPIRARECGLRSREGRCCTLRGCHIWGAYDGVHSSLTWIRRGNQDLGPHKSQDKANVRGRISSVACLALNVLKGGQDIWTIAWPVVFHLECLRLNHWSKNRWKKPVWKRASYESTFAVSTL